MEKLRLAGRPVRFLPPDEKPNPPCLERTAPNNWKVREKMIAVAVVGLQWGDEGKGKIVDLLAADAAHVARFQGGHNAGHTLVIDGQKTTLHLLPSGILQPQSKCYIGNGVVLSPPSFLQEVEKIEKKRRFHLQTTFCQCLGDSYPALSCGLGQSTRIPNKRHWHDLTRYRPGA